VISHGECARRYGSISAGKRPHISTYNQINIPKIAKYLCAFRHNTSANLFGGLTLIPLLYKNSDIKVSNGGIIMRITRVTHGSPIDALVAVAKRLSVYEERYRMDSEKFFAKYQNGEMKDTEDFLEWANDYKHYMALKIEIERQFSNAA